MSWKLDSDLVDVPDFDWVWEKLVDGTWVEERDDEEVWEEGLADEEGLGGGRDEEYEG